MLNPVADPNALSAQLGFLNANVPTESGIGMSNANKNFSAQLQALMQGRTPSQGQLGLIAQAKALNVMDEAALEQLAQKFSLELDLTEGETVFDQLSSWLAEQGLVTGFAFGQMRPEKKMANADLTMGMPGDSDVLVDGVQSEFQFVSGQENQLGELTDETTDENLPAVFADTESLVTAGSIETSLDTENIADHVLQTQVENTLSQTPQNLVAENTVDSANILPGQDTGEFNAEWLNNLVGGSLVEVGTELQATQSTEFAAELDEVSADAQPAALDLAVPTTLVNEVNPQVIGLVASDASTSVAQAESLVSLEEQHLMATNQQQQALEVLASETDAALISAKSGALGAQSTAPGLVGNPQQVFMQRQAQQAGVHSQSSHANGVPDAIKSDDLAVGDVLTKSAVDASARVLTAQQQVVQNTAQQQVLNLNNRELQALQQQEALKASDLKLVNADESVDAELLVTTSSVGERKASSPFLASISYPLRHPQWSQSVGKRIVFMVNQQMQQAQIRLNPEHLGPVQVRLQIDRDQMVSVAMTAQHGTTREALEAAIPKLKEMLEEAGIHFDSVSVEDERHFSAFKDEQSQSSSRGKQGGTSANDAVETESPKIKTNTDNMIDFYA